MDVERFRNSPAGKVAKVGQGEAQYWAFVPNALPPRLKLTHDLLGANSDADRALGELAGLGRSMLNPHLLIGPFIRREAVLSSRIEGTQTSIDELYTYEAGQLSLPDIGPRGPQSDVREVLNYVRALEYGLTRLQEFPVSLRLLKEMHEHLLEGVRGAHATPGEFRKGPNWIGPPGCTLNDADFIPPPVHEMQQGLHDFENHLHTTDRKMPLIRLAEIHYQFEAIHPFVDGNGRIGRLLVTLLLVHWDLLPLPLLYLSAFFERHRQDYYDVLMAVSEKGAWSQWIMFFLEGIREQAADATMRAKALQDLQARWHKELTQARASALLVRLADTLFASPILTTRQAQDRLGAKAFNTAAKHVNALVDAGVLEPAGKGKGGQVFAAREIIRIVT